MIITCQSGSRLTHLRGHVSSQIIIIRQQTSSLKARFNNVRGKGKLWVESCLFLHLSVFVLINSDSMTSRVLALIYKVCNELIVTLHAVKNTSTRKTEFIYGSEELRYGRSCNFRWGTFSRFADGDYPNLPGEGSWRRLEPSLARLHRTNVYQPPSSDSSLVTSQPTDERAPAWGRDVAS